MFDDATLAADPVALPAAEVFERDPAALSDLLVRMRRHLHRHPELGQQEHETAAFIRNTLRHYGLAPHPAAGTGTYVDIAGNAEGPHVAYRADIDALPTQDAKHVPYRSQRPDIAHLCGHDAHTAIGLGVALRLHRRREALPGTVRVFFQPNEENMPSGAPLMIEEGVLDDVRRIYAVHVDPTLESGRYGLITGPITAAADRFDVHVRGTGTGHSARPHETVDTVWVAAQIMSALYQLVGRVTDPRNATVLTICRLEGGQAHNVIPAEVRFGGTLRTVSRDDQRFLRRKIRETARQIGALHGAEAEAVIDAGAPAVVNDAEAIRTVEEVLLREAGAAGTIYPIPRPSMGAEDFAHYLEHVPGALIRVGSRSGPETAYPLHDDRFDLDEAVLAPTARLMSEVLLRSLRTCAG